jgi:hypothetical protein
MKKMYKGKVNSPATLLVETIDSSVTSIKVADGAVFPEGPNVAVIGTDGNAETIKYESINGNILVGCVRGFQGKASVWDKDTIIARNFTEYDLNALQENILELDNNKVDKAPGQGLISDSEKNKLANIEDEANKYVHPNSHPAGMITENSSKRFVSDSEKEKWNDKVSQSQITGDVNASGSDKVYHVDFIKKQFNSLDSNKADKNKIPTKISQLINDKTFKTESEIQSLINNSTKLKKEVVTSLPSTGKEDVIYLLKNKNDTNNYYTEYMWISGKWEIIGDTKVDLSDYAKKTEIPKNISELREDSNHRTVTDSEKEKWNKKIGKNDIVNNLIDGGIEKALSAEQGKVLFENIKNNKGSLKEVVVPIVSDTKNKNGQEVTFWTDGKMVFYFIQLNIVNSDSNVRGFHATIPVGFRGKKLKIIPQIIMPVQCYGTTLTSTVAVVFNEFSIYVEGTNNKPREVHYFGFYPLDAEV